MILSHGKEEFRYKVQEQYQVKYNINHTYV